MVQGIKIKRNKKKILNKLNDLLITNREIENIYSEASKTAPNNSLKVFLNEKKEERKLYNEQLDVEIEKLLGSPIEVEVNESYKVSMNFRNLIFVKDHSLLVAEVCRIKEMTVNKYNALLSELNLPLSLCKLLSAHRDSVQESMNAVKRLEHLIVKDT